jgi:tetratricopeptide (TPR) repeat protein
MSPEIGADFAGLEDFKERCKRALETGQLEVAEHYIEQARTWANEHGDERQRDYVTCACAAVAIQLGRGVQELPRLREILMRGADPNNCRLAAYHISLHYELVKSFKKSLFYARIALERAEALGRPDWLAASHNQIGNALLGESFVGQAYAEYERALGLMTDDEPTVWRAHVLMNLGYCNVLQERFRAGYTYLYRGLRMLRKLKAERYLAALLLDLCFAHLETGRYRYALRHATLALRLAEKTGHTEAVKNALFLIGEAANLSGDASGAREHFTRLHEDFFPRDKYLPGFLLAVDVRKMINLHA